MSIESPKIEKKPEKSEARKKFEKKLRTMIAWGTIAISSLPVFKLLEKELGLTYDQKATMAYVEKQRGPLTENEKIELQQKINYLRKQFGNKIIPWLKENTEANKEVFSQPLEVNGFEKVGLSSKDLQKLWSEKYYPKGWLNEEVAIVEYQDTESPEEIISGFAEGALSAAHKPGEKGKSQIVFFKSIHPETNDEFKELVRMLNWHFSHEVSHANDWDNEAELDFKRRIEFLHEITQSCFREGAFRDAFGNIESIKNSIPFVERYNKTREYWANICDRYFAIPKEFKEVYPDEFALVDKYVKIEDPTYDPVKKCAEREAVINQIVEKNINPNS